jgi:glycine oxidase
LPIRPIRGQIVLYRPYQPLLQQVLMLGKRYLVPRADGRILAGSTEEPEAGFDRTTTPEAIAELQQFAAEIVPELDLVEVEAVWSGLRPACGLGGPVIGRLPGFPNIVVAAGHFRSGVQLSLGTAELVRALVMNEEPIVPLEPFRWDRPADDLIPLFRS